MTRSRSSPTVHQLYVQGSIDRLDVAYTQFLVVAPDGDRADPAADFDRRLGKAGPSIRQAKGRPRRASAAGAKARAVHYEFLPDAKSILEEIVPVSFKVRLFKCFLDAAVSEQIARMVAMGGDQERRRPVKS